MEEMQIKSLFEEWKTFRGKVEERKNGEVVFRGPRKAGILGKLSVDCSSPTIDLQPKP